MKKLLFILAISFSSVFVFSQNQVNVPKVEASYTGGSEALNTYITKNVKKPKGKTTEGIVYVEFIIESTGKVANAKVLRGIDTDLDKIALDAVSKMPNWIPAKDEKGNPINSKMTLPIKFK